MSLGPKVIITPFGGHATEMIRKRLRMYGKVHTCSRPDYIFSDSIEPYDLHARPNKNQSLFHCGVNNPGYWSTVAYQWGKRSDVKLNPIVSIHNNLLRLINTTDRRVLLFGKCSLNEPFLTNNEIEALCMVRYPLHAYSSFLVRRHPQWGEKAGGTETMQCAEWYGEKWNAVVDDFVSSGNPIVHYETLIDDLREFGYDRLADILAPVWKPQKELHIENPEVIKYLKNLGKRLG